MSEPVARTELRPRDVPALPSEAVTAIAGARCDREVFCFNVGAGKKYPTEFDCRLAVRAKWVDDLNRVSCTRGIDEGALANCLREIRETGCDDFSDSIDRLVECREDRICRRAS